MCCTHLPFVPLFTSVLQYSLFRSIFKELLNEMRNAEDETRSHSSNRGENDNFELSVEDVWDNLSLTSHSTKDSMLSTDANRFRFICEELSAPPEFVEVVGRRLLGIRDKNMHSSAVSGTPNLDKIVDFLADAFIRCTKHADLTLLALDDVHELDEMSWRVVQTIWERGNVLVLCGSRPPATNPLAIDTSFWEELHNAYSKSDCYVEFNLQPLTESDTRALIASSLEVEPKEISDSFSRNLLIASGGLPHFLSYAIDAIKRESLATRLDDGLIGLKSAAKDESKVSK